MGEVPETTPEIPHHQLRPGDVLRWQCDTYPHNVHRWRVFTVAIGGMGQEGLIECESLTHRPGYTGDDTYHPRVFIPEVLVRQCTIEDVGDRFGVPSARRFAK